MPDIGGIVGGVIGGLLGIGQDIIGTAVGAAMSWLGFAVDAMAQAAAEVMNLLPDAGDLGLTVPSGWLLGYGWLDGFLPLHETVAFLGVLVTAAMAVVAWRVAVVVYHLIPKPWMGT